LPWPSSLRAGEVALPPYTQGSQDSLSISQEDQGVATSAKGILSSPHYNTSCQLVRAENTHYITLLPPPFLFQPLPEPSRLIMNLIERQRLAGFRIDKKGPIPRVIVLLRPLCLEEEGRDIEFGDVNRGIRAFNNHG
jgi:hypothetical protein